MNKEDYKIALTNPFWKTKRLRILKRDGYKCRKCKSTNYLHIHHLRYEGEYPWDTRDKYLITLCKNCHNKVHKDKEKLKNSKIMQKVEINQYRLYGKDNIIKSDTVIIGNKNITDYISEEDRLEFISKRLSLLRDIATELLNVQKSGTLKITNHATGEIAVDIDIRLSFKSTPMSPTKKAKMLKASGYKPKAKVNDEY